MITRVLTAYPIKRTQGTASALRHSVGAKAFRTFDRCLVIIKLGSRLITWVDHPQSGNILQKRYFIFSLTFDSLIPLAQALPHCCYCYCFFCNTNTCTFFPYVCSPFPSPYTASFQASWSIHFGYSLGSRDLKRIDRTE